MIRFFANDIMIYFVKIIVKKRCKYEFVYCKSILKKSLFSSIIENE